MAYPPTVPPNTRTDATPLPTNMPSDINTISNALTDIINELGGAPKGTAASVTALLDLIDPADAIIAVGGATAPTGWGLCDGETALIADAPATFARIGTTYGGDGITTFGKPDLRSRFIAGKGTATWSDTLNETGGSKDAVAVAHTHSFVHDHAADQPAHGHAPHNYGSGTESYMTRLSTSDGFTAAIPFSVFMETVAPTGYNNMAVGVGEQANTADPTITVSNNPSGDKTTLQTPTSTGDDTNLPPYVTLNYCIRLR